MLQKALELVIQGDRMRKGIGASDPRRQDLQDFISAFKELTTATTAGTLSLVEGRLEGEAHVRYLSGMFAVTPINPKSQAKALDPTYTVN